MATTTVNATPDNETALDSMGGAAGREFAPNVYISDKGVLGFGVTVQGAFRSIGNSACVRIIKNVTAAAEEGRQSDFETALREAYAIMHDPATKPRLIAENEEKAKNAKGKGASKKAELKSDLDHMG